MAKKKKTAVSKKKVTRNASKKTRSAKAGTSRKKSVKKKLGKKAAPKKAAPKKVTKKKLSKKTVKKKPVAPKKAGLRKASLKKVLTNSPAKKSSKAKAKGKVGASKAAGDGYEIYVEPKVPKTRLTSKQLKAFRQRLIDKRRELLGDVRMLTRDALGKPRQESSGDLSNVPIHMADIGSDNWEQDFTIGLIANERELVRQIDDALVRIKDRTYGVCLATFKPITVARLRAKPWAKYTIEHARELEMGRG